MREQNGGRLRLTALRPKQRPPRFHTHRAVYELDDIAGIHDHGFQSITSYWETAHKEWGAPALLVPFCGDGHWWLCLDYRTCGPVGDPCITHFEPAEMIGEKPKFCVIADSFDDLIRALRFDAGEVLLFALDQPDLLEAGLARGLRSLGCQVVRTKGEATSNSPRHWRWNAFASSFPGAKATLRLSENGTSDAWHLARPAWHPLLVVNVSAKDQDKCARMIHDHFGGVLSLIHVPTDRRAPRGMPVEATPVSARPRQRPATAAVSLDPTALNAAVLARDRALIRRLLSEGLRPDKSYGPKFVTALEIAAAEGNLPAFKLLLESVTRRPTAKILSAAVRGGNTKIVKHLTGLGLKPTPGDLLTAVWHEHAQIVRHLINLGVKPSATAVCWAAGVPAPNEYGCPTRPNHQIMMLMQERGLKTTNKAARRRYETL